MFDPYNPNDVRMAQQYEDELFLYAKDNPYVGKGMSVEVYNGLDVCCEGRVLDMKWSPQYNLYVAKVLIDSKEHFIFDSCLRRSRGAIRNVINGGLK